MNRINRMPKKFMMMILLFGAASLVLFSKDLTKVELTLADAANTYSLNGKELVLDLKGDKIQGIYTGRLGNGRPKGEGVLCSG